MAKRIWRHLDHSLWHLIKDQQFENTTFVLAVSGGLDSVALLRSFSKVLKPSQLTVAHFHHGGRGRYRQQAQDFCATLAAQEGLSFVTEKWRGKSLRSEADFRQKRYEFLKKVKSDALIVTAHHAEDVMETRLIRLIRGTGPQGLMAMSMLSNGFFRPFLTTSRKDLETYVSDENLKALSDPSNQETDFLRNWLRKTWLPQLEKKRPGGVKNLSLSLQSVVEGLEDVDGGDADKLKEVSLRRAAFLALSLTQQRQMLARYMLSVGLRNFTQFHINEVRRRVLAGPKQHTFTVAGGLWTVNAQQITLHQVTF